jgi:MFS family permease
MQDQQAQTGDAAGQDESSWPSASRGWLVVVLLALASIASQFDRTVINLTVEPLKQQFSLNDTQFGMLQGIAFGVFYTLACFPVGRLADRYARKTLIGVCLAIFSLFAMGSGLARSYAQLFLTRIGVGIGEASVTPGGLSMLSDLFPSERLGKPVGAFLMSAPVGQGLAFMGGGYLLQWLTDSSMLSSGMLEGFEPWQAAFIIIGFPGLLLAPMFLLLREPARRGPGGAVPLTLGEMKTVLLERRQALVPMFTAFSMVTLVSYTLFIWTPALFQRSYGWTPGQVGVGFGLVVMIFGTAGAYFGGWMSDHLMARGYKDAPLRVAAYGFVGCGIFGMLAPLMPSAHIALLLLIPAVFLSNTPYACAGSSIQMILPNRARGQVTAIYITILTLVGLVIGPMVVGLMTDYVFKDPNDIRYSLAIVVGLPAPIMFTLLLSAFAPYRALRERMDGQQGG